MDEGTAALIGALIGSSTGLISMAISSWYQKVTEKNKWIRDEKQKAYFKVLRYIYRVKYKRSNITADALLHDSKNS